MHIHYFQHDDFEDLAYIGRWAEKSGIATSCTRFDRPGPRFPLHSAYDWLIIMGGAMGAYEDDKHPWLSDEKRFIREAIELGKTVFGICLGSQLVAASLGAKVYPNTDPEIGFFPVVFNASAAQDGVFCHFPQQLTVMHWHNDTFELPDGAILMASSEATKNQAFRWGKNVFAFQFHFEMNMQAARTLVEKSGQNLPTSRWIQLPEDLQRQSATLQQNNDLFDIILSEMQNLTGQASKPTR